MSRPLQATRICTFHVRKFSSWSFPTPTWMHLHLSIYATVAWSPVSTIQHWVLPQNWKKKSMQWTGTELVNTAPPLLTKLCPHKFSLLASCKVEIMILQAAILRLWMFCDNQVNSQNLTGVQQWVLCWALPLLNMQRDWEFDVLRIRLDTNAAVLPNFLAWSIQQRLDSKTSKSRSLQPIVCAVCWILNSI